MSLSPLPLRLRDSPTALLSVPSSWAMIRGISSCCGEGVEVPGQDGRSGRGRRQWGSDSPPPPFVNGFERKMSLPRLYSPDESPLLRRTTPLNCPWRLPRTSAPPTCTHCRQCRAVSDLGEPRTQRKDSLSLARVAFAAARHPRHARRLVSCSVQREAPQIDGDSGAKQTK